MNWRYTLKLRLFSLVRIPLIAFIGPVVEELDAAHCVMRVPLGWKTKNHLGSMFFGTLTTGADTCFGLLYMKLMEDMPLRGAPLIKNFEASFLKRVEGDAWFHCPDGAKLRALFERSASTGERSEDWIEVTATVPSKFGNDPAALFRLLVSIKAAAPGGQGN
jgi:acyl-coenzyme A thioesterase PaaI-like protein